MDWRLCQDIKQKQMDKINSPRFLVRLKFQNGDRVFECSYEQLQDLLNRLKVAKNSVKRLVQR